MTRIAILASAAALLAMPSIAHAGDLSGTVNDSTARPVAGAQVTIPALGLSTVTDADGTYRFEGLAAGEHRVAVELANDERQFADADVPETGEATRNIFLYSSASLEQARNGINPVEAMLAEALMAQAWDEARRMTAQAQTREPLALPDFTG